jgi:hypothetical protein
MLDVTLDDGVPTLCHGPCWLGSIPHIDQVLEIADFLQNNPREVLFIIYQDDIDPAFIAADYEEAGLTDQLWAWDGGPMPTLGQLLEQNKRLILSAESAGPPPLWYHHAWDLYWDTPYSYTDPSEFTCELNRGAPGNPLFLINHWLSDDLGLPTQAGAAQVNTYDALYARATQCAREAGRPPHPPRHRFLRRQRPHRSRQRPQRPLAGTLAPGVNPLGWDLGRKRSGRQLMQ